MKKLTKIIATVGPSSDSEEKLTSLINHGVNIFRFNMKHNDLDWHREKIKLVKEIAKKIKIPIGVLIDLQGPEIRTIVDDDIELKKGDLILCGEGEFEGPKFNISHPQVIQHITLDQKVVVEDGRARFNVKDIKKGAVILEANDELILKNKKTFNLPGASYPMPVLTEKDQEAIKMAASLEVDPDSIGVDFVALSFVRTAQDIADLKAEMKKSGLVARVIPKIETRMALDNLDEIVRACEGLMVARGDLGIEIPYEQVPYYQKLMIKKCLERGIPVITATQMLISMVDDPYPTRAEVSDIANAVYDFTDCTMLSEETAAGKHVMAAVKVMAETASFSEKQDILADTRALFDYEILDPEEMLCDTAYNLYLSFEREEQPIGGFIVFSQTGRTGRKLSRYRPKVPIFVFTPNEKVRDGLIMSFGVEPLLQPKVFENSRSIRLEDMKEAFDYLVKNEHVNPEGRYILLYGDNWGVEGGVSTIKIVYPKNLD